MTDEKLVFNGINGLPSVSGEELGERRGEYNVPDRPDELQAVVCYLAGRNLTWDEWQQYLGRQEYRRTCGNLPSGAHVLEALPRQGDIDAALSLFAQEARLDPNYEIPPGSWNALCWFGSLWGRVADVLFACDKAVTLAPEYPEIRDSRGLARALTGDTQGAIDDFRFFVDHWEIEAKVAQSQAWIAALEAGQNPFDQATLDALRNE